MFYPTAKYKDPLHAFLPMQLMSSWIKIQSHVQVRDVLSLKLDAELLDTDLGGEKVHRLSDLVIFLVLVLLGAVDDGILF